jgi:protein phosphatase
MGGHQAGEVAARIVVDDITDRVRQGEVIELGANAPELSTAARLLVTGVYAANQRILELAAADPACSGMGTTVVAAILRDNLLTVVHAGDSRAYLLRDGELQLLTTDDSWMASMLAEGIEPDSAEMVRHPLRNVLTNAVGLRADMDVHVQDVPLLGGEVIVLTTDGIHGVVEPGRLAEILADHPAAQAPSVLIAAALARGSRDNCTAVVAEYVAP